MTSEKLQYRITEIAGLLERSKGAKTITVRRPWVVALLDSLGDIADQVEAMEEAEQINGLAIDALARIRNDAERSLNRASKANAADNAP